MLGLVALTFAALFSGAAVYVLFAEHPARARLAPQAQLTQWKPAYERGTLMQAPLALLAGGAGVALWFRWGNLWFLAGGLVMLAVIVSTFAVIWPVNNRLKTTPEEAASAQTVALLQRWGRLHAFRCLLGLTATAIYAAALYRL